MEWTQPHFETASIKRARMVTSTIKQKRGRSDNEATTLGIDLAKSIFRLHGVDTRGTVVLRRQLTRKQLRPFLAKLSPCLVGMEACAGAHYWAREIERLGHTVRLMSPHFVTPYRKSQKNDGNDAEAICEAVGRPHQERGPSRTYKRSIAFVSSSSSGAPH
jgi:transposase